MLEEERVRVREYDPPYDRQWVVMVAYLFAIRRSETYPGLYGPGEVSVIVHRRNQYFGSPRIMYFACLISEIQDHLIEYNAGD